MDKFGTQSQSHHAYNYKNIRSSWPPRTSPWPSRRWSRTPGGSSSALPTSPSAPPSPSQAWGPECWQQLLHIVYLKVQFFEGLRTTRNLSGSYTSLISWFFANLDIVVLCLWFHGSLPTLILSPLVFDLLSLPPPAFLSGSSPLDVKSHHFCSSLLYSSSCKAHHSQLAWPSPEVVWILD